MNRQSAFAVACAVSATAALGVVASPVGAFTLAPGATIFTAPVSLDNFLDQVVNPDGSIGWVANDNAFQVDDKIFHEFVFQTACQAPGTPGSLTCDDIKDLPAVARPIGPTNPADITVGGSSNQLSLDSGHGLLFNDFWKADAGWGYDLALGFDVHIVEGSNKYIKDAHLGFVPEPVLDQGVITISEKITDPVTGVSLLDDNLFVDNLTSTVDGTEDWVDLIYPVKKLRVLKNIRLSGVDDLNPLLLEDAEASVIIQEFSQTVPEPGAVTGLLAIGSLSVGAMLKRHFGKKA
ncbi:PEP-CTERM putative exosortase interaction domain protein [Coleofasciculus chthonoplastes PCC 7420]|uniref:PEP-CTERM putative exosortase interaction domain protein n=1 Tax=Coleofasciculus chthonoplastes PCC 7420 TaxID=118168 RepID=B4VRS8_9CYAN|nr:hypothetical protein [Coleofasciculus chthonoplastes]EDX75580.1 PEP-CTERM putative exosortase interaction domain protein [Coleofasciculus chthonoplastes PCC 7420]